MLPSESYCKTHQWFTRCVILPGVWLGQGSHVNLKVLRMIYPYILCSLYLKLYQKANRQTAASVWYIVNNGMTNYPIGPHRTQSDHIWPHRDPIGLHRTPPDPIGPIRTQHRTSSRQPQDSHSFSHSRAPCKHVRYRYNRYTRKVTNLNTIETNPL